MKPPLSPSYKFEEENEGRRCLMKKRRRRAPPGLNPASATPRTGGGVGGDGDETGWQGRRLLGW